MVATILEKLGWPFAHSKTKTQEPSASKEDSHPGGFTKDQIAYARELAEQERQSWVEDKREAC